MIDDCCARSCSLLRLILMTISISIVLYYDHSLLQSQWWLCSWRLMIECSTKINLDGYARFWVLLSPGLSALLSWEFPVFPDISSLLETFQDCYPRASTLHLSVMDGILLRLITHDFNREPLVWSFIALLLVAAYTLLKSNLVWQFSLIKTWTLVPALNREQDLNSNHTT